MRLADSKLTWAGCAAALFLFQGMPDLAAQAVQTVLPQPLTEAQKVEICEAIKKTNPAEQEHLLKLKNNQPPQIMTICAKLSEGARTCPNGPGNKWVSSNKCQTIKINSKHWNGSRFVVGLVPSGILSTIALAALLAHESLHTGQQFDLVAGGTGFWGRDAANDKRYAQGEIDGGERQIQVIVEQGQEIDLKDLIEVIRDYQDTFRKRANR